MTVMLKRTCVLFILLLLPLTAIVSSAAPTPPPPPHNAEILWDKWGVPHINAKDTPNLFYGLGWAQMESHGDLLLRLYGESRGRAAEYWGGAENLESDKWVRMMGVPMRAAQWYNAQTPAFRANLDAFAEGINDYARQHPDRLKDEMEAVLPVSAVDVLAHTQRVINFTFVSNRQGVMGELMQASDGKGSNGWAIAPSHSASKRAMLLTNPHLPWFDLFLFYEAQLTAPGINSYGVALVGFPVLGIAFNDHLGWTHTVNPLDGQDLFQLKLAESGYRFDGKVRAFESEQQTIKIKQPDGTLHDEKLVIKRSLHGPVVFEDKDNAVALRVVGLDRPGTLQEWWDMGRAQNLKEFEAAVSRLQLPFFNIIYADRNGHIMYLFNGLVPRHASGDWKYWSGVVPGDTSATLWTQTLSYRQLPKVIDPANGWVQNTNDAPWTATFPRVLDSSKFPPSIAPHVMSFRSQRSVRMLQEDGSISFDEMIADKHSTRSELADRVLDDLIKAARTSGDELTKQAATVLEKWDHTFEADSRGAALFTLWAQEMKLLEDEAKIPAGVFAKPWDENNPLQTPSGLAAPKAAVAALTTAANTMQAGLGALDVPYGDLARLRVGKADYPANGGFDALGIFRVVNFRPTPEGIYRSFYGDSYVAAVEFSTPLRARALLSYGNSSQPDSPHRGDQLALFAKKELRPVLRTRAEIEANLESREVLK